MEERIKIFGLLVVLGSFFWLYFANISLAQNACSGDKPRPCSETYPAPCTTSSGQPGVQTCYKFGCSPDGRGGPACEWGPGSYCEPCRVQGQPTPTPVPNCRLVSSGRSEIHQNSFLALLNRIFGRRAQAQEEEAGYCTLEGLEQGLGAGQCQAVCSSDWSYPPDYPGVVECKEVVCSCGNARTCCRIGEQPTPTPPGQPTETPPAQNTPTPTPPPPTPPPVTPGVPTPTPTPTIIYLTPTPKPGKTDNSDTFQKAGQTWVCLKSQYYSGPIGESKYSDHRLKLTGNLPTTVKNLYIVGCIEAVDNIYCTTGDAQQDTRLRLTKLSQHRFELLNPTPNPFVLNSDKVEAIVYSSTRDTLTHKFYAVFKNKGEGVGGRGETPQYGTIVFNQGAQVECVMIRWDPRGRVVEKESLKPVEGTKILLLDLKGRKVKQPGVKNPVFTDKTGRFEFMVEEGEYFLNISVPEGYELVGPRVRKVKSGKDAGEVVIFVTKKNRFDWLDKVISSFKKLWRGL